MAYTGKIGFHFPARGNPNLDTKDIKFLPSGITNPTSSDLVQVNKVYAIPAGVTITSVDDLQNYVVWEKVSGYVKYIMYFIANGDDNFTIGDIFLNGNSAGQAVTNGDRSQSNENPRQWHSLTSSQLQGLQNGADVGIWGDQLKITITTTNANSLGFQSARSYIGQRNFTLKIIGVDSDNNETELKTESITINSTSENHIIQL